jgi:hypothetical protein
VPAPTIAAVCFSDAMARSLWSVVVEGVGATNITSVA